MLKRFLRFSRMVTGSVFAGEAANDRSLSRVTSSVLISQEPKLQIRLSSLFLLLSDFLNLAHRLKLARMPIAGLIQPSKPTEFR